MVKLSRTLPSDWLKIFQSSIQRNAYYAHQEHIVLAMANDADENIRKMAWMKISAAREENSIQIPVRRFTIPKVNFDCTDYTSLIDIPMTVDPPNIDYLASKPILEHEFGQFLNKMPLHTQAVERCVKLVTEKSRSVCGEHSRDGSISNTLASRNIMSKFDSKSEYTFSNDIKCQLKL